MNVNEITSKVNVADNPGAFEPVAQMRRLGNLQPAILMLYKTLGPNDLIPVQFQFERRRTDLLATIPDKSGVLPSSKTTSPDHLIEETTDTTDHESIDGKAIKDVLQAKKAGKNQRKTDLQGRKRAHHSRAERDPSHQYLKEHKYSDERPVSKQANSSPQQRHEHERIVSRLSNISLASSHSAENALKLASQHLLVKKYLKKKLHQKPCFSKQFRGRNMRAAPKSRVTSAGSSRPPSRTHEAKHMGGGETTKRLKVSGQPDSLSAESQRKTEELYNRLFVERLEKQDRIFEKLAKAAESTSPRTGGRHQLRRERRHSDVSRPVKN